MLQVIPLSSLVKVFSDEKPTAKPFDRLSLFRNEKASVQIAVCSDADCSATLRIDSPLGDMLHAYVVREIYAGMPVAKTQDDYTLRNKPGVFPELLCPLDGALTLRAGEWRSIWLEVVPNPLLPVGVQTLDATLDGACGQAQVRFTLDVIDASLPEQTLIYTNWFHTDCIATHYGVPVFSERYWELVERYLRVAREYGMNMVLTPLFTPPLDTKIGKERETVQLVGVEYRDNTYTFDFSRLDRWIDMCDRVGIEYLEMSHLFTQWGAKRCPKIVATVDGQCKRIFGWNTRAAGKKYRAFLAAFAPQFKAYIREKGISDRIYFHVSDEPAATMLRSYRKASEIVAQHFGEFRIFDALSDYKFYQKGLVRLPVPANDHIEPFVGKVDPLWTYYCSAQSKDVSNRFFSMPSQRNRVLGCQMYLYDVKGFLHWGYNFWYKRLSVGPVDPFTETDAGGFFPSGDSFVVYPGEDGTPLQSLRLKVFYDALQDMRALQWAESLIGRARVEQLVSQGTDRKITFAEYPHSDEWQLGLRETVNDAIRAALGK